MKKQLLNYINELLGQSFSGWSLTAQAGYETALVTMREKIKKVGKPEYIHNVRRVYNSADSIETFNKEVESDGWEVRSINRMNDSSSYVLIVLRKEKE